MSRFPERFRFQLTKEEYENLKSQFVISSLEDDMAGVGNCHLYSQNKE
ncbi:ORF6N domain-containing protein [Schaedlerella arabinosiphila]